MQRILIVLVVGLLSVGCGEREYTNTRDLNPNNPPPSQVVKPVADTNATKPIKELTAEEKKIVGSYEAKLDEVETHKLVFLGNRTVEGYTEGFPEQKDETLSWEMVGDEVHASFSFQDARQIINWSAVYKIEPNGDLTEFAVITDGKRTDYPTVRKSTYKKIK